MFIVMIGVWELWNVLVGPIRWMPVYMVENLEKIQDRKKGGEDQLFVKSIKHKQIGSLDCTTNAKFS